MSSYFLSLLALSAALVSAATPQAGKSYTVSPSAHPDLCVVPKGDWDGARLAIEDCDSSDQIAWVFDGQSLKNHATQRCVDVLDGGHWNGNGLQTWTCFDHNTNQRFDSSSGAIQWLDTGMCLDLTDGQSSPGTYLQVSSAPQLSVLILALAMLRRQHQPAMGIPRGRGGRGLR